MESMQFFGKCFYFAIESASVAVCHTAACHLSNTKQGWHSALFLLSGKT